MTMEECSEKWLIQIEKFICLIENEFLMLNEKQLTYRLHIRHCNIKELMTAIYHTNAGLLASLNPSLPVVEGIQKYKQTWVGRYFLSRAKVSRCLSKRENRFSLSKEIAPNRIFSDLLVQENKLKEVIYSGYRLDMNKKAVPFKLAGLIKLSLGETLDYIVIYQQRHFTRARYLLKIQQE